MPNRLPRGDELSARILSFLAADDERLADFLVATGITPASLRVVAGTAGFAEALIDYIQEDDLRVVTFAAFCEVTPEEVGAMPRPLRLVKLDDDSSEEPAEPQGPSGISRRFRCA